MFRRTKKKLLRILVIVPAGMFAGWIVLNVFFCQNRPIVPDAKSGRQYSKPCKGSEVFLSLEDQFLEVGLLIVSSSMFAALIAADRSLTREDGWVRFDEEKEQSD